MAVDSTSPLGELVFVSTAQVRSAGGKTTDDIMARILERAPDPSVFTEKSPFIWTVEASSTRMDSYFTRMHPDTSLKNYAADADAGISFLDSHVKSRLGYGQSLFGRYLKGPGDGLDEANPSRMEADFFTIPGITLNGIDTDSFIDAVRSGAVRDVSIGFIPGTFECSMCGLDPYDWWDGDCMHIPGLRYDAKDKIVSRGGTLAFAWVKDARLSEVSAVYDGATPGAHIMKAQFLAEDGQISRNALPVVERALKISLPHRYSLAARSGEMDQHKMGKRTKQDEAEEEAVVAPEPATPPEQSNLKREESPAGVAKSAGVTSAVSADVEDLRMNDEQIRALEAQAGMVTTLRAAFKNAGIEDADTVDVLAVFTNQRAEIERLTPLAADGETYRDDLIRETLELGTAAHGKDYDPEMYRAMLTSATIKTIRGVRDDYKRLVEVKFPGGRHTTEVVTPGSKEDQMASRQNGTPEAQFSTY